MQVLSIYEYNQGVGKFKLLSSTAGVGALVTTKLGITALVSDIDKWPFMIDATKSVKEIKQNHPENKWYEKVVGKLPTLGISLVDDLRFIEFLRSEKELPNLFCLIEIPHLTLHEHFNTINKKDNPRIIASNKKASDFVIPASHFPKWFYNNKGKLMLYKDWYKEWNVNRVNDGRSKWFAPPRDYTAPIKINGQPLKRTRNDEDGVYQVTIHPELSQTNLVLICPNGHLSDIPWSKYLNLKTLQESKNAQASDTLSREDLKIGKQLFTIDDCCRSPKLRWTENKTKSEGYSSVYIECESCHKKYNLEGITNLKPQCRGHKPWEVEDNGTNYKRDRDNWELHHHEQCLKQDDRERESMQVALVTGNNTYYANVFSSIYIPEYLSTGISPALLKALNEQKEKYEEFETFTRKFNQTPLTLEGYTDQYLSEQIIADNYVDEIRNDPNFINRLRDLFLNREVPEVVDRYEDYRWKEYSCFINNARTPANEVDIKFEDVTIPDDLLPFFKKIQKVENLKVSAVQLNFSRVFPIERVIETDGSVSQRDAQNIFSSRKEEVLCLPSVQTYGEGIFLAFDEQYIANWISEHYSEGSNLHKRIARITKEYKNDQGLATRSKIRQQSAKYLLIHSFSHALMRELEFSCGYPTASLKERLYISDRMSGVLIYTAEGSEGSMGGLISQTMKENLRRLVFNALERADHCSSDPLCWESDGQGIFNLNLAACFSCALVSETACEERNLGLDRRVLIDQEFGYFRSVLALNTQ